MWSRRLQREDELQPQNAQGFRVKPKMGPALHAITAMRITQLNSLISVKIILKTKQLKFHKVIISFEFILSLTLQNYLIYL